MRKYEIVIEDDKAEEWMTLLQGLPYVKEVKETTVRPDAYSLASEEALAEDWLLEEDDELQKLYGK